MVCKNSGIYVFLGTSWVLITMTHRKYNEVRLSLHTADTYSCEYTPSSIPVENGCTPSARPSTLCLCTREKYVCCTQEHDGDDPFYIREFHISMRHYVY